MNSFFFSCHLCGSYDSEILTPAYLQSGGYCDFQKIVICKSCGLVYKNPVIPSKNTTVYNKVSWKDGSRFQKRISELATYLSHALSGQNPKFILEIGPGPGWLAASIEKQFPGAKLLLSEVSEEVAKMAQENTQQATVVPASIDEISLRNRSVDLALVCGVDYLFVDHRGSMEKIYHALADNGYLYIERNVFVEAEAYAGFSIRSYQDLFGQNALMTTWFNRDQFKKYLEQWFDVVSEKSFSHDTTNNSGSSLIHGFLCKKRQRKKSDEYYQGKESWHKENRQALDKLSKTQDSPLAKNKSGLSLNSILDAVRKPNKT